MTETYECETATSRENEFLKMQYNSIVIQLKPAVAWLHKKEMQLCKLYLRFAFKLNSYDKTKKSHISFIVFEMLHFRVRVA